MTIYKYELGVEMNERGEFTIEMPCGARPIHAGLDPAGTPCLWAEVQPENALAEMRVAMLGTGHTIPSSAYEHVASFNQNPFIWHVYAVMP